VRQLVAVTIEPPRQREIARAFGEQMTRTGKLSEVEAFNCEVDTLVRSYLETRRKEMRKVHLDVATFICVGASEMVAR
jgi:hypothetical protein